MRKQDKIVIWPVYFDQAKTRREGRRIPKSLAAPSPKILEIKQGVEKLGIDHEIVLDACHPKIPRLKTGMLLMSKKEPKNQTIKKIARQLIKIRSATQTR